MTRRMRQMAITALAAACCASVVQAHAIHTTLTVATLEGNVLTLTIRSFADDYSLSVARHAGRAAPRDSSVQPVDVMRYVAAQVTLTDGSGHAVPLMPCGIRRTADVYFTCVRAALPRGVQGLRLRNGLLTELHADQVNIVQLTANGERRTLLFTRASPPSLLGRVS